MYSSPALLDPKLLQLFDLLYSTHSVTRTADLLGMSQPTMSIWLARLRDELRDPLFIRTQQGMQPTPQAEVLIGQAREVLDALRRLSAWEPVFDPATTTQRFRICMTDASQLALLPPLLAHMRVLAPGVRLAAAHMDHTGQALEAGEADLALGYAPWLESGIYQQALFHQDWVCLANRLHPRLNQPLDLATYTKEDHISVSAGTSFQLLENALTRSNITRHVVLELSSFLGLDAIVGTTDLVITLPRQIGETLARMGNLAVFDCPLPVPGFMVKQHWHARFHNDTGNKWLRGVVADLFMKTA